MSMNMESLKAALNNVDSAIRASLDKALADLDAAKARVAAERKAAREAEVRKAQGLKEVRALMRNLKVTLSDLTDPRFA